MEEGEGVARAENGADPPSAAILKDNAPKKTTWKRTMPNKKKGGVGSRTLKGGNKKKQPTTSSTAAMSNPASPSDTPAPAKKNSRPTITQLTLQLNEKIKQSSACKVQWKVLRRIWRW
jgi:hypothetical protein